MCCNTSPTLRPFHVVSSHKFCHLGITSLGPQTNQLTSSEELNEVGVKQLMAESMETIYKYQLFKCVELHRISINNSSCEKI